MNDINNDILPVPNPWLQAIRALAAAKKFSEAETKALNWTLAEPKNAQAWLQLSNMREYQQNYTGSIESATRAILSEPDNQSSWWYRGYQYLLAEMPYLAELDFDKCLELSRLRNNTDRTIICLLMRAQSRRQLGDYQGALDDCSLLPADASFMLNEVITVSDIVDHCSALLKQGSDDFEEE